MTTMHSRLSALLLLSSAGTACFGEVLEDFTNFVRPAKTVFAGSWASSNQAPASTMKQGDGFFEIRGSAAASSFVDIHPSTGRATYAFPLQNHLTVSARIMADNRTGAFRVFLIDASGNTAAATFDTGAFSSTAFSSVTMPLSQAPSFNSERIERIRISGDSPEASTTLAVAFDEIATSASGPAAENSTRNFSAKARVGTGAEVLIAGFLIPDSSQRSALMRAIGPGLAPFGLTNVLADPKLQVYSGSILSASNDNWSTSAALTEATTRAGAFALTGGSRDAALVTTLFEGVQSVQISGVGGTGTALFELYRLDSDETGSDSTWKNFSARGYSGAGAARLVAGFVIRGHGITTHLIRVAGPALSSFGVSGGLLADPKLQLMRNVDGKDFPIAGNDNWGSYANQAALTAAIESAGAFRFAAGSKDAALLVNLPAGIYTITAESAANAEGIALIEMYEVR